MVASQFADPSVVSMTFEGAALVQSGGSRFAVTGLAPGATGVAKVLIPDEGTTVEAYTVDIDVAAPSNDASFTQVSDRVLTG